MNLNRHGGAGQGKARQGKARQGKARQGKARQGKARKGTQHRRTKKHMRFQPKWTAAEIAHVIKIVDAAPNNEQGCARAAETFHTSLSAIKGVLRRVRATPPPKRKPDKGRIHVVIGDTQVKEGVPTAHLTWIGRYIADHFVNQNVAIIHLGDHWDMPSLSSYDQGKKASEGRRYEVDVDAGNKGFELLNAPIEEAIAKNKRWKPERHFLMGNHEDRVTRACNDAAFLDGAIKLDDLKTPGWQRHAFLAPVLIDGITYAHYFIAQGTGKPLGGENVETRLKTVGTSFTMGHQQGRKWAERNIADGRRIAGLVLGSTYLHDEEYRGPQGNKNWRGIVVCHQVENGQYDPMFVSLDWLCRRYEGKTLAQFLAAADVAA